MRAQSSSSKLNRVENIKAFLFILPPIIGFCIFTIATMVATTIYSFQEINQFGVIKDFIGFDNFVALFTNITFSDEFVTSIGNTLILLLSIPIQMILGLVLAGLMNLGNVKGAKIFQILFYLPAVSSGIAINIVWRDIFADKGVINTVLHNLGIINYTMESGILHWVTDNTLVKVAIIIKNSLNGMGGSMIMYLAGMLNVPKDYYEAADIDGAGKVRQFFSITLPLVTPMTFYMLITGLIGGLQSYADAQVFANGTYGSRTIVYFVWSYGIGQYNYGLASAASILLALGIMLVTLIQFKYSTKWVYED